MAQELEDLLIKVDSECGDLKGIDSAISALYKLSVFAESAQKGAGAITTMAGALNKIDSFGRTASGIKKAKDNVDDLVKVLEKLSQYTGKARESISQLSLLGKALQNFRGLGTSLKDLDKVTIGINNIVEAMRELAGVTNNIKGTANVVTDLGKSMDFSKQSKGNFAFTRNYIQQLKKIREASKQGMSTPSMDVSNQIKADTNKNIKAIEESAKKQERAMQDVADNAEKAVKSIGRYSEFANAISKLASQNSYDSSERAFFANTSKNYASKSIIGTKDIVTSEQVAKLYSELESAVNSFLHSHPYDIASFSPEDISSGADLVADGITKQYVLGLKEISTFDFSKVLNKSLIPNVVESFRNSIPAIQNELSKIDMTQMLSSGVTEKFGELFNLPLGLERGQKYLSETLSTNLKNMFDSKGIESSLNDLRNIISDEFKNYDFVSVIDADAISSKLSDKVIKAFSLSPETESDVKNKLNNILLKIERTAQDALFGDKNVSDKLQSAYKDALKNALASVGEDADSIYKSFPLPDYMKALSKRLLLEDKAPQLKNAKFNIGTEKSIEESAVGSLEESIKLLNEFREAIEKFEGIGDKLSGVKEALNGINGIIDILKVLSEFTGRADESIVQLKALGEALQSFDSIGKKLEGIDKIQVGINAMIDALVKLSGYSGEAEAGILQLGKLGEMLHEFNGLDATLEHLNDIASGLIKFGAATSMLKGSGEQDFSYISKIAEALRAFDGVLTGRQFANVADITYSLGQLVEALDSTKEINTDGIKNIGAAITEAFSSEEFKKSASGITDTLNALSKAYGIIVNESRSARDTMITLVSGFTNATDALYKIREDIEAIATDFTEALKPVTNSALFDTLREFKRLNDSYKNVAGLGQGLGMLLNSLNALKGQDVKIKPLVTLLTQLEEISKQKNIESIAAKFEMLGNLAQPVASLLNALKYTDLDNKNTSLSVLGTQLANFYENLPKGFKDISFSLNAIKALIELAKGDAGFDAEDNAITKVATSLKGFGNLTIPELKDFVKEISELVQFLNKLPKGSTIETQPIKQLLETLQYADASFRNAEVMISTIRSIKDVDGLKTDKFHDLNEELNNLIMIMGSIPNINTGAFRDIGYLIKTLSNIKNVNPDQLNLIADALTRILKALGGIQGSGNRINITLDSSGITNFQEVVKKSKVTWDEFAKSLKNDLEQIDLSDLFDFDAPLGKLKKSLYEAERMLRSRLKKMHDEANKMQVSRATRADYQNDSVYQTQFKKYQQYRIEAEQLRKIIAQLNEAIKTAPRFNTYEEGYKQIRSLKEEYESLKQTMERFNQGASMDASTKIGQGFKLIQDRMQDIEKEIEIAENELENMEDTEEVLIGKTIRFRDEMNKLADEAERASQEIKDSIGEGFGQFGSMLSGSGNGLLKSIGNVSDLFGRSVKDGTAKFSDTQLKELGELAGSLGTLSKAFGQIGSVVAVAAEAFKIFAGIVKKIRSALEGFAQSLIQFAKNMLSKVVGAFNAVAGAVSKTVSAVRSGSEAITAALRKIADVGRNIISVFGKAASAIQPLLKGVKAIAGLVTPKIVKTLVAANGSIKNLVKNSRLLTGAIKAVTRYFSMLTRMLMRKSITAFINAMKQAFEDMVLFEKNAEDEMLQLNYNVSIVFSALRRLANQVIAIFEPLINAMATPVEAFITSLTAMGENFAKFMAILTGQPYYLRAKKFYEDYGKNVEDTSKKVKNLTNGLDELNILNDSKDDDQISPEDMFEKVPVDGSLKLPEIAFQDILDKLKDFLRNIPWDKIYAAIRDFIHRLMTLINQALKDLDLWKLLGETLAKLFNALMVAWNQFIIDFDPKATEKALSTLIVNALNNIDWGLIHQNIELTAKKFAQFWNEVFADQALWDSITRTVTNALNEIVHFFDTWAATFDFKQFAQQLTDSITKVLNGFDWSQLKSAVDGWVGGLVNVINTAAANKKFWEAIGDTIAHMLNDVLIEGLNKAGNINFTDLTEALKTAITRALNIDWDSFNEALTKWADGIANVINGIFADPEFLGNVTTNIANFANAITNGLDELVKKLQGYDIGASLAEALTKGFQAIDWNAIIALPLDLLNQFTQALQGFADTVNGFDIGTDLADKITNFLNAIDWAGIQQALSDFGDDITGFINALIAADDLWKKLGETAGNLFNTAITIPLKLIWDIDYDDLGTRIAEAINKAIETANISEAISSIGKAFQNIVDFLSSFVVKLDWSGLGTEIGKGIADAIRNIDAQKLRKLIFDAFSGLSDLLGSALKVMLENGTFYELGEIVGNFLLGVILGLSKLLYENRGKLSQAMKQFADGLANFLDYYHDYIVNALNSIIESIGILIRSFFDNKGKIMNELYEIIGDLNLGDILGDILFMLIRKFISNIKLSSAMIAAVVKSIGGIFKGIFDAIKPYLLYLLQALLAALGSFLAGLALGKAGSFAGGALGGLIGSIFGPVGTALGKKIGSAIGEKLFKAIGAALGAFGGFNLGDWLKDLFNGESLLDKAKKGWDSFWDKMPWNKNKKVTPKVEVEPQIDVKDTKMPDFSDYLKDSSGKLDLSDYDFKLPDNLTGGGSISYDTLNVNTIYANVLKVGEIIGGKLTISGIDGLDENLYDKLNKNQRDKSLDDTMLGKIGVQNPQDFYDQIAKSLSSLKKNGTSDSDLSSLIDYLNQAKLGGVTGLDGLMDMSMFMNGQFTTDGLIEGLKDKYPELEEAGSGLYVTVHDAYRKEARIHSPSEAMYENGQLTGEGLYNGIKEWIEPLKDLMRELVDELLAALQELVDKVDDILKKLEALGGKQMAEDIGKLTDELDNILEKLEKINKEIKEIPKLIQKNMKKAEQEFKKYIDRMIKDFEKLKDAMEKFFKDLPKKVKDALDECYRAFEEWAKKIRELFDGLTDAFDEFVKHIADTDLSGLQDWSDIFDGLAEAADEELSRTNDELKFWLDLMKKEIEDFNLFALTMWDGLLLETRNAFYLVWLEVEGWLNKLRKLIEDFKRDLKGIWDGLAAEADREMAKVYDVVREWLEKIRDLIKNASTNMFAGLSEAIKRELDKAYQYVCQWVEDVKKKLDEAFAYLNSLLDGGLHITASVNANADALNANTEALRENTTALWANTSALNALTDAIKALQNKLGTIKCECNCGCNCGNCAMGGGGNGGGNGGSGSKQNEPNYADNSGNGTGGTINNPDNSSNNNGTSTPQHNGSNDSWNNDGNKGGAYDPPDSGKNGSGKGGSPSSSDSGNNNGDKGGSPSASSSGSNDGNKDSSSGNSSSDKPKVLPSVKEALEKGLDGMVETNSGNNGSSNKDSNSGSNSGNNNDSGNSDNSNSNNGDNNGKTNDPSKFGRAVFDANTGLTTEYDAQGNVIGTHQAAGQWGDKVYDESWTGSMKDRHDAQYVNHARSEFDTKTGILRVYDENGNVVSEEQKDGVWNGIKYKDGKPVDEKDDLGEYITMFARTPGKNYTEGNSLYEWNRLSPSNLDPAINSKYSQLNNPFDIGSTMFYFKTKDGTFIKDSETLAKIRNFIISEYGITDKYKPETNDDNTQTKEATEPKVDQNYLSKVKSAIDSRDASKRARGNAGSGSFALNKYSQQGADLVHKIANGTEQLTSFFMEGVSGNANLATQKEAFDYWYKNSFLVKGYQMGGVPNSGEIYVARENGSNEFIGSFGNRSVVANNDQIVTAVANGVSMANDSLRNAIDNQTQRLESAINSKELEVSIGDRQIAEANKRGQKSMGQTFVD